MGNSTKAVSPELSGFSRNHKPAPIKAEENERVAHLGTKTQLQTVWLLPPPSPPVEVESSHQALILIVYIKMLQLQTRFQMKSGPKTADRSLQQRLWTDHLRLNSALFRISFSLTLILFI